MIESVDNTRVSKFPRVALVTNLKFNYRREM